jgi:hypothetical protein
MQIGWLQSRTTESMREEDGGRVEQQKDKLYFPCQEDECRRVSNQNVDPEPDKSDPRTDLALLDPDP